MTPAARCRGVVSARGAAPWQSLVLRAAAPDAPRAGEEGHPADAAHGATLTVDLSRRFQTHLGFGGAFTEAAALTWQALPADEREALLRDWFDPVAGHGFTLGRVAIGGCDFSLGDHAHAARPDDFALDGFELERDRRHVLPFVRAAMRAAGRSLQLMASPWSPPAWMKTQGAMTGGGRLRPECRAVWAQCFVRFVRGWAAEGVPIWAVSVQNEPMAEQRWESCLYSAEEERDFVRDHLGPALHAAGLGHVKVVVWDHNRDLLVDRARVIYGDPDAARFVWGTGFHWYGPEQFDAVQQVHDAWPDKALIFTEGCQEGGPHPDDWGVAERYARNMLHDLNRWTVGWIDWNLLLDAQGGPNHVGNFCHAPVLADATGTTARRQPSFWAQAHFARTIRPQAQRVGLTAHGAAPLATAFENDDGTLAVVVGHLDDGPRPLTIEAGGAAWHCTLPGHSIASFVVEQGARA